VGQSRHSGHSTGRNGDQLFNYRAAAHRDAMYCLPASHIGDRRAPSSARTTLTPSLE
jgi:hypothetical protein